MRRRNTLFRRAKKSGNPLHFAKFKHARNKVVSDMHCAKAEYFRKLNPSNSKQFWKSLKYLNKQSSSIPTLNHNGSEYCTDPEKANVLNSYFNKCFNHTVPPISPLPSNDEAVYTCPPDILCTVEEVQHMLQKLDTGKANGPDAISARMLKHTASAIAPSVTELFNLSIRTGQLPKDWKVSYVVPIPKRPGAKSPSDFRPISLLSVLSKVLERHFHMLISDHLSEQYPLSNCQWGFQPNKSALSALISTTHDWLQQLEAGNEIGAIFFDFEKAFDRVPHQPLMSKLMGLGLDPYIMTWLHNYLANRRQSVVVGGTKSASSYAVSGVPQGSILGPLLFLIYIDDVTYGPFSPGTRIVLYADDILLYRTILSNSDYSYLQSDANTVQDWVNCNHMSLNPSKCKFMLISRKRNRINNPPMIIINGQILESVPTFKYLGLLLTSDLSWSKHIEGACTKAKKILGLLYRRFYQHADQDTLCQLYISIVRPHMEYAAPVWDPHLRKDQDLLESTQKFACTMITRKWDKGYDELLNMTNLPSLADRRLYLKLCSLYKIVHTCLIFHLILLYLKSLDRTQALLLPCTSPLHILIVF